MEVEKTQNKIWMRFLDDLKSADSDGKFEEYSMQIGLMHKLGISFVALCELADIYVMQNTRIKRKSDSVCGTCVDFFERFSNESSRSVLYRHLAVLKAKRLILEKGIRTYRIPPNSMEYLQQFNDIFYSNLDWQKESDDAILRERFEGDPMLRKFVERQQGQTQ